METYIRLNQDHIGQLEARGLIERRELCDLTTEAPSVEPGIIDNLINRRGLFATITAVITNKFFNGLTAEVRYRKKINSLVRSKGCDAYYLDFHALDFLEGEEFPYTLYIYKLKSVKV